MNLRGDDRGWRIRPHATGVRTLILVQQAFVVLGGGQWQDLVAMAHDHEAGLFTSQKFFDHHTSPGLVVLHAQGIGGEHVINGLVRLLHAGGHDHAFASGQAIGFDHDGNTLVVDVAMGQGSVGEGFVPGRGNAMAAHEVFGEGFGALKLGRGLGRAENAQTMGAKFIHHTRGQQALWPHHGDVNLMVLRPFAQSHHIGDGDVL